MDDIQLLIYIIFVVIALLSRFLKKKKEPLPQNPDEDRQDEKQVSFEDLLREFSEKRQEVREQRTPTRRVIPAPSESRKVESVDTISDEEVSKRYQESIKAAESELRLEREVSEKLIHFKNYETEAEENLLAGEIKEMLNSPEDAAKAIVLSEIINRKY